MNLLKLQPMLQNKNLENYIGIKRAGNYQDNLFVKFNKGGKALETISYDKYGNREIKI